MRRSAAALVTCVLLAACGTGADEVTATPGRSTPAAPAAAPSAIAPAEPTLEPGPVASPSAVTGEDQGEGGALATEEPESFPAEASTDPIISSDFPGGSGEGVAYVTRVEAGRHRGFDRVVWEFDGPPPGFRVEYAQGPVREAGSGDEVDLAGDAVLGVTFSLAAGVDLSGDEPVEVYTGPDRIRGRRAGTRVVTEARETGDFENTLSWAVGLREAAPFTVTVLGDPTRVVLDIAS